MIGCNKEAVRRRVTNLVPMPKLFVSFPGNVHPQSMSESAVYITPQLVVHGLVSIAVGKETRSLERVQQRHPRRRRWHRQVLPHERQRLGLLCGGRGGISGLSGRPPLHPQNSIDMIRLDTSALLLALAAIVDTVRRSPRRCPQPSTRPESADLADVASKR